MKQAIKELSFLFSELLDDNNSDISVVLNTRDAVELVSLLDITKYDESTIRYDGEYHFVSSTVGSSKDFIVENIHVQGRVVHNETDILILPEYILMDDCEELMNGGYNRVVKLTKESTLETLIRDIETNKSRRDGL